MTAAKDALHSRMTGAATRRAEPDAPAAGKTAISTKPARVTLNLPPALMRDVERWTVDAAGELDVPRVSIQDAMRAMIRAAVSNSAVTGVVVDLLRQDQGTAH